MDFPVLTRGATDLGNTGMNEHQPHSKIGLISIANAMGAGGDPTSHEITMGDIISSVESRGFSALITVFALFTVLPTGAIPGVPAIMALLLIIFATQNALGLKRLPLPGRSTRFSIERAKMLRLIDKSRPTLHFIDRFIHPRLDFMCNQWMERIIAVISIALALTFFPLGFIPFATMIPATAILLLSAGLLARDGILVLLGFGVLYPGAAFLLPRINLDWLG